MCHLLERVNAEDSPETFYSCYRAYSLLSLSSCSLKATSIKAQIHDPQHSRLEILAGFPIISYAAGDWLLWSPPERNGF